ncbi:GntR family transcriptional regulator [Streptomyces sp. SID1328]|uniref:GntR family transcriptional regulator n=1 Tax=Streptomyces sp. SID1328 TaxID=2690250 RepID=UPI00136C20B6|nr:GntR family transcriptional regulator [Streptomyces sp. SID1328]MYV42906.1 GntR family transcriptional regulator [Streptomyces sp. SID1328]
MNANTIAAAIRKEIATGQHPYGSRLPTVRELAEQYGVSQQTAASAYSVLAALGLVRTDRRSGTTVTAGRQADAHLGHFTPPDLGAEGAQAWRPTSGGDAAEETTLVRQITATDDMNAWGIPEGSSVVERTRIRSVDGAPVQHKLTVLPYTLAARTPEGYDGIPPMLAPVGAAPVRPPHGVRMADWLGWDVAGTEVVITTEPMDKAAADALGVPEGTPAFRIVGISRDGEGQTVVVTVTTAPLHHRVTLNITG